MASVVSLTLHEPVIVAKHGRAVVVVLGVEEFERLKHVEADQPKPERPE